MSDSNSIGELLLELLPKLRWLSSSSVTELREDRLVELRDVLSTFFLYAIKEEAFKSRFSLDAEYSLGPHDLTRAVAYCLSTILADRFSQPERLDSEEVAVFGKCIETVFAEVFEADHELNMLLARSSAGLERKDVSFLIESCQARTIPVEDVFISNFYFLFSSINQFQVELEDTAPNVDWHSVRKEVLKRLGIKPSEKRVGLRASARNNSVNEIDEHEIRILEEQKRILVENAVPAPKLVNVLSVLLTEVKNDKDRDFESWVKVWDSAYDREPEIMEVRSAWPPTFQECVTLLLKGALPTGMRKCILTCFTKLFDNDSFTNPEREAILTLSAPRGPMGNAPESAYDALVSLLHIVTEPSTEHLTGEESYLRAQFAALSSVTSSRLDGNGNEDIRDNKLNPSLNNLADAIGFTDCCIRAKFNARLCTDNGTGLRTILLTSLIAPTETRERLAGFLDEVVRLTPPSRGNGEEN